MSSAPPLKRKRLEPPLDEGVEGTALRSVIWFKDGDLILQTTEAHYRVHKDILAAHSTIFRDMLDVPQPLHQPTLDGCAVIAVTDSAEDWDELLPLLYDLRSLFRYPEYSAGVPVIPIKVLIATLRLGHKWDTERFRRDSVCYLRSIFPDTLAEFQRFYFVRVRVPRLVIASAIQLAEKILEVGLETILPFALYVCVLFYESEEILQSTLPRHPQTTIILAKHQMTKVAASLRLLRPDIIDLQGCRHPYSNTCQLGYSNWLVDFLSDFECSQFIDPQPDALRNLHVELCPVCYTSASRSWQILRKRLFCTLPQLFKLQKWQELQDLN